MGVHQNARTTPLGRSLMIRCRAEGWTIAMPPWARLAYQNPRKQKNGTIKPCLKGRTRLLSRPFCLLLGTKDRRTTCAIDR